MNAINPQHISLPVALNVSVADYPTYQQIRAAHNLTDEQFVNQAVAFALTCYRFESGPTSGDLATTLVERLGSIAAVKGRVQHASLEVLRTQCLIGATLQQLTQTLERAASHEKRGTP